MKVLITGRDGQVGWELHRQFLDQGQILATSRNELDLARLEDIRRTVRDFRPDLILNAAAYTAVDLAETQEEQAQAINAVAPGILAEEARRLDAFLVHYSTDYVFDGKKAGAYVEDDLPNPLGAYGRTKLEGELRVRDSGCRHLVLRCAWVYGPRGKNFFLTIARHALAGKALRVVSDQRGVPSESRFIAECTRSLVERGAQGVLHLVPGGSTSWHGFAQAIVERLKAPVNVAAISSAEYPAVAKRPANSVLSNAKVGVILGDLPSWQVLLDRCVSAWTPP